MAIVNRSPKTLNLNDRQSSPDIGPTTYQVKTGIVNRKCPGFLIKKPEYQSILVKKEQTPGPGHYDYLPIHSDLKTILEDQKIRLRLFEREQLTSNFKSVSRRFEFNPNQEIPGPGTYDLIPKQQARYQHQEVQYDNKNIIKEIFKSTGYQPVPSIPHNSSTEKHFFMEDPEDQRKCIKTSQNNRTKKLYENQNLKPGTSFSKSRSLRIFQTLNKKDEKLGPGCYFTSEQPLEKPKLKPKKQPTKFIQLLDKQDHDRTQNTQDTTQDSFQYIKDAVPGPGSYEVSKIFVRSKSQNRFQSFGGNSRRFQKPKMCYQITTEGQKKKKLRKVNKNLAFGRKINEDNKLNNLLSCEKLGPGHYQDPRTLQNQILKNIKKSYQGNFGFNDRRFKESNSKDKQTFVYQEEKQISKENVTNYIFKSKTIRGDDKFKTQGSGQYYSQNYNTIQKKIEQKNLEEQDKIVKSPAFNTGEVRFAQTVFQKTTKIEKKTDLFQKEPQPPKSPTFSKSTQKQHIDLVPGPGSYNIRKNWNSKTFNVLYIK